MPNSVTIIIEIDKGLIVKILVTGGAGFIGSAVIRHIIKNTTNSVINLDKLTYAGNLQSLESIDNSERYSFEQVDICERSEIDRVLNQYKPDAIMQKAMLTVQLQALQNLCKPI